MKFLAPAAWAFAAVAIPVILFYLLKTRLRRRLVSTDLFWQQLSPQIYSTSLWRRLRRWLSLFLQILLVLALTFALTQPLASWQSLQPVSLVLVLDPSASMQATDVAPSRWERARQLAEARLKSLRAFDEATLILASDPPQVLSSWSSGKRTLLRALAGAHPENRPHDIRPAVALARNLAEARPRGRVLLLTDSVWPEAPANLTSIEVTRLDADARNHGLTLFAARRALTGPTEFQLAARVEMRGPTPISGSLEIYRDGRLMDAQPLTLTPGQPWEKTWEGRAESGSRFEARLTGFPADHFALDDRAEAALAAPAPVRVVLVAPPNGFLDAAMKSLHEVKWERTWPVDRLGPAQPGTLYLFYRALPPAGFTPDAQLLIDPSASGPWGELRGKLEQPLISEFQREFPLLRHAGLENISLQTAREFAPVPGAAILAESFGKPLVFGNWSAERKWLVLAFDLESSDLVLRTAFPIVLGNAVESVRREIPPAAVEPLPGTVESGLVSRLPAEPAAPQLFRAAPAIAWWSAFPVWWWAAAFGLFWLLAEWWTYSRRITE